MVKVSISKVRFNLDLFWCELYPFGAIVCPFVFGIYNAKEASFQTLLCAHRLPIKASMLESFFESCQLENGKKLPRAVANLFSLAELCFI